MFFRLAVSRIHLPPLRERRGDIRLLARQLVQRVGLALHRPVNGISEKAMRRLETYDWPGNVRELENVLSRATALSRADVLSEEDLNLSFDTPRKGAPRNGEIVPLREAEKKHIELALESADWNITRTARLLEISPTTLRKKVGDYQLRRGP